MESRVLLVTFTENHIASALRKVLGHITSRHIECVNVLQNRGERLVNELRKLEGISGHRLMLSNGDDGRWESLIALALTQDGSKPVYRVLVCGVKISAKITDRLNISSIGRPLSLDQILSWLASAEPSTRTLSVPEVEAVRTFLCISWHDLKYCLFRGGQNNDQVCKFFHFLDSYSSSESIKTILGDVGSRVSELGEELRREWSSGKLDALTWDKWREKNSTLISCCETMNNLSPKR